MKERIVESKSLGGLLGTAVIAVGFILAVVLTGSATPENVPLITVVLGFLGLILNSIIGRERTIKSVENVGTKVDRVLNGEMEEKIRTVVREVIAEGDQNS